MYENVYHGFGPARTEAMAGRRSAAGSESVHWKEHRPFFRLTEPHSSLLYGDGTEQFPGGPSDGRVLCLRRRRVTRIRQQHRFTDLPANQYK